MATFVNSTSMDTAVMENSVTFSMKPRSAMMLTVMSRGATSATPRIATTS